jgi:SAM-dependent methyltransferase
MKWTDEMIRQSARPAGELGIITGKEMNECHYELWQWGLSHVQIADNSNILDIGCGGGGTIKLLSDLSKNSHICGIDISEDMVALSQQTNENTVHEGRIEINQGSVSSIPYPDDAFNLVTAFETDYFWPDLENDFREILRVLRPAGTFIIVDDSYDNEAFRERNARWSELNNGRAHAPDEYRSLLAKAKFNLVEIIEDIERNWITVISRKP